MAAGAAAAVPSREGAIKIVTEIQRADYEGDRAALKRLSGELAPFLEDEKLAAQIRYWRGFALWRRAINGFNDAVDPKELQEDLQLAVDEFDAGGREGRRVRGCEDRRAFVHGVAGFFGGAERSRAGAGVDRPDDPTAEGG